MMNCIKFINENTSNCTSHNVKPLLIIWVLNETDIQCVKFFVDMITRVCIIKRRKYLVIKPKYASNARDSRTSTNNENHNKN